MPELPEVETVKNGLKKLLPGLIVVAEKHDWPKGFPNTEPEVSKFLIGATVKDVRRRAKVLMIDLSTGYSLVIHLKMTGQLVFVPQKSKIVDSRSNIGDKKLTTKYELLNTKTEPDDRFAGGHPSDSLIGKLPDKSTRVTIKFKDKSQLFFNDQRKFGWMRLMPTSEISNIDFMRKVGPEPLEASFSVDDFIARLMKRKNSNIKAVLLDQTIIAGIGNIYADESLFAAKIHPASIVIAIPKARLRLLFTELINVLDFAIAKGGSTDRNYVNAEGKRGSYTDFAKVFRRNKQPCPNCSHEIIKLRVAGRGTHVCSKCQVLYTIKPNKKGKHK